MVVSKSESYKIIVQLGFPEDPEALYGGTPTWVIENHVRPSALAPEPLLCCRLVPERPTVRLAVGTGGKGGGSMSEDDFSLLESGRLEGPATPRSYSRRVRFGLDEGELCTDSSLEMLERLEEDSERESKFVLGGGGGGDDGD